MPIETPFDEAALAPTMEPDSITAFTLARIKQATYRQGWAACVKALRATGVEWSSQISTHHEDDYCPICGSWKSAGHTPDCALAAILTSVKEA